MYKPLFCFGMAVGLLAGCGRREDVGQLKAINQSLESANRLIQEGNILIKEALLKKKHDMRYYDEGVAWEAKGTRIKNEADSIVLLIEKLKIQLLKATDSLKEENSSWLQQFSASEGQGYKLVRWLAAFRDSFPVIIRAEDFISIPYRYERLKQEIIRLDTAVPLLAGYVNSLNDAQRIQYANRWVDKYFSKSSPVMILVELNKLENDLLVTTNRFLDFCLDKTKVLVCGYPYSFSGVVTLNSSYVKQDQLIEVTAGVGEFSATMRPRISVNGKEIKLNDEAIAVYRFTAKGKPGKHTIRVAFDITRPDGTAERMYKDLKYIIADEK